MFEIKVKFETIEDIKSFHKAITNVNCDVDAVKGSYVIDAKSMMGLLSMDLSDGITLVFHTNDLMLSTKFEAWKI